MFTHEECERKHIPEKTKTVRLEMRANHKRDENFFDFMRFHEHIGRGKAPGAIMANPRTGP